MYNPSVMNALAMDVDYDIPGGDDFQDVTALFAKASAAMDPEEMIMMEGFSLQDAMSALEIGEPRLDTGMSTGTQRPFNPLTPLLPEELCWIMDRSMAYEMEWHSSNQLAHTVYTLLYIHHLQEIDPDMLPYAYLLVKDPNRPLELITIVLRAWVCGLLKCCDLVWRKLSKSELNDTEDWQPDKCEISLLERWPTNAAIARLADGINWLTNTTKVPSQWREALAVRLRFRLYLLQLIESDVHDSSSQFRELVHEAQRHLSTIRSYQTFEPTEDSPARATFDPYIARRLNTFMPVRVVQLPTREETWAKLENWLDGLAELTRLAEITDVATWDIVGNLRNTLPTPALRPGFVRACLQAGFHDYFVSLSFPSSWLVDRFFLETIGEGYDRIVTFFGGHGSETMTDIEKAIIKTLQPHIRGQWFNPPRRRRHLAKEVFQWHIVYDMLHISTMEYLNTETDTSDLSHRDLTLLLLTPCVPLYYRYSCMRDVILSGFQLGLYSENEKDFAYWYIAKIIEGQLELLDRFVDFQAGSQDSETYQEMFFQRIFLTALQIMCEAMFLLLVKSNKPRSQPWSQMRQNLMRRYKWAFSENYDDYATPPMGNPPDLRQYLIEMGKVMDDNWNSASEAFSMANLILSGLIESESAKASGCVGGWARDWKDEKLKLLGTLAEICENLAKLKGKSEDCKLVWDPTKSLWFPLIGEKEHEE